MWTFILQNVMYSSLSSFSVKGFVASLHVLMFYFVVYNSSCYVSIFALGMLIHTRETQYQADSSKFMDTWACLEVPQLCKRLEREQSGVSRMGFSILHK